MPILYAQAHNATILCIASAPILRTQAHNTPILCIASVPILRAQAHSSTILCIASATIMRTQAHNTPILCIASVTILRTQAHNTPILFSRNVRNCPEICGSYSWVNYLPYLIQKYNIVWPALYPLKQEACIKKRALHPIIFSAIFYHISDFFASNRTIYCIFEKIP